jgi:hypothetical protein
MCSGGFRLAHISIKRHARGHEACGAYMWRVGEPTARHVMEKKSKRKKHTNKGKQGQTRGAFEGYEGTHLVRIGRARSRAASTTNCGLVVTGKIDETKQGIIMGEPSRQTDLSEPYQLLERTWAQLYNSVRRCLCICI